MDLCDLERSSMCALCPLYLVWKRLGFWTFLATLKFHVQIRLFFLCFLIQIFDPVLSSSCNSNTIIFITGRSPSYTALYNILLYIGCNVIHTCLRVSPTEQKGGYFWVSMHKISLHILLVSMDTTYQIQHVPSTVDLNIQHHLICMSTC